MIYEDALNIYTDGSCLPSPRSGGIGIRYVTINSAGYEEEKDLDNLLGYPGATNNQMELYACIVSLEEAPKHYCLNDFKRIIIFTDSKYVTENINRAKFQWCNSGWKNLYGKPIENAELWKKLIREIRKIDIKVNFQWIKGHARNKHNKAVDKLARRSAKIPLNKPLRISSVRRKTTDLSVQINSVKITGQKISIRIITDVRLSMHNIWRYKYEVISRRSKYYRKVDFVDSKILLRAGRSYTVRMNKDQNNPQILKMYKELSPSLDDTIETYQVSSEVNKPGNDSIDLIKPAKEGI